MLHLLNLEWSKFRNNNVIITLIALYLALLPTTIFIGKKFDLPPPLPNSNIFYEFPTVWDWMAYSGSWLVFFFLGFVALFIITSEVQFKTLRQNIITGLTRKQYFTGKVYIILAISILATIYFVIATVGIGMIHSPNTSINKIFDNNWIIPRYFLMCMGYMSFGLLIGSIVKKSSLATLIYLTYILFIESLLKWQLHDLIFPKKYTNYWPMNVIEDLSPNPYFNMADSVVKNQMNIDFLISPQTAMVVAIVYIIIFLSIGYWTINNRDL